MDIKQIQKLARILKESDLSVIEVSDNAGKIRLERTVVSPVTVVREGAAERHSIAEGVITPKQADELKGEVDFNDMLEIKSPMVGVFYRAPSPESEPYVSIGDKVKKGDVLCIVEAMKLMNEIVADCDGEILDICATDGQVVEFGQTLYKLF